MQLERKIVADGPGDDYALVSRAIAVMAEWRGEQSSLEQVAARVGVDRAWIEEALARWCGLSFGTVQRTLSAADIRARLVGADALLEAKDTERRQGYDMPVVISTVITDDARRRGAGLDIVYGFHPCPFGEVLVMVTGGALCGIAFVDEGNEIERAEALADMTGRWPKANFEMALDQTGVKARQIFAVVSPDAADQPLPLALIGTAFDVSVWQTLLRIPLGRLVSYTDIARHLGRPDAVRAVGTANGRNPISFVVPCHRALRGDGSLGGYYWGLTRKRALIVWEAGRATGAVTS